MFQNILSMDFSPDLLHKQDCGQKRRECFAHVISVADLFQSVRSKDIFGIFWKHYLSRKLNRFSTERFPKKTHFCLWQNDHVFVCETFGGFRVLHLGLCACVADVSFCVAEFWDV